MSFPPPREVGTTRYAIMLNAFEMLFMIMDRECTFAEIAEQLSVSAKTVERMAKALEQIVPLKITRPALTVKAALRMDEYFDSEDHRGKTKVMLKRKDFELMLAGFKAR